MTSLLDSWQVRGNAAALVFDTTSSNTGSESGAAKFIEEAVGHPILYNACRLHVSELHIMKAVQTVTGSTKDPGVSLFRCLKKEWNELEIDLENLVKMRIEELEHNLQSEAKSVLQWATDHLKEGTWPRDDYREMLELLIVSLGGDVPKFNLKLLGPDHHACWMSKVIYILKCRLVSNAFEMTEEERYHVDQISKLCIPMLSTSFSVPLHRQLHVMIFSLLLKFRSSGLSTPLLPLQFSSLAIDICGTSLLSSLFLL